MARQDNPGPLLCSVWAVPLQLLRYTAALLHISGLQVKALTLQPVASDRLLMSTSLVLPMSPCSPSTTAAALGCSTAGTGLVGDHRFA